MASLPATAVIAAFSRLFRHGPQKPRALKGLIIVRSTVAGNPQQNGKIQTLSTSSMSSSSSSSAAQGPVYELSQYRIKPDKYADYKVLLKDHFQIRLEASMPLGYWTTKFGALFEVVHIWPYESVDHRAEIQQALVKNPDWNAQFMPKFLQYVRSLQNSLLVLYPGTSLNTDFQPSPSAAYELQTVAYQGGPALQSKEEILVGRFKCIYGAASGAEYRLVRYPDAATAFLNARKRQEEANVICQSKLLIPLTISSLK